MSFRTLKHILISARPLQWLKNLSIFTALIFSGNLLEPLKTCSFFGLSFQFPTKLSISIEVFVIFCLLVSALYIINDVLDREKDQLHPTKSKRPIASGALPSATALMISLVLLTGTLIWSYLLSIYLFSICIGYILLMLNYSLWLKEVVIIDAMAIAFGFVLRVMAGRFSIEVPLSSWLVICTIAVALLISFGRRRAEVTLMGFKKAALHRPVLEDYPKLLLNVLIGSLTAASFLAYCLFTFFYPKEEFLVARGLLPGQLEDLNWMMVTIPITFYALARYLYVIYGKREGDTPERQLFRDLPMVLIIIAWGFTTTFIIYSKDLAEMVFSWQFFPIG